MKQCNSGGIHGTEYVILLGLGVGELSEGKPEGKQDGDKIELGIPIIKEGLMHANENDFII